MTTKSLQPLLLAATTALLSGFTTAQISGACVPIGTGTASGCQSGPLLTGGVVATADVEFQYDAGTALLDVRVVNTSPVVAGEMTPIIVRLGFNFPAGAVSSVSLQSQTSAGANPPQFSLLTPGTVGCFGDYDVVLAASGDVGGIGNPSGNNVATTADGPVVFVLQLAGSGVGTLTAADIVYTNSTGGSQSAPVATKFQAGGVGGAESGFVGSGGPCCPSQGSVASIGAGCAPQGLTVPTISAIGTPTIGSPIGVNTASPSSPSSFGLLTYGFSTTFNSMWNAALPIDLGSLGFPGCSLYVDTLIIVGLFTDGNGDASHSFYVPPQVKWCGSNIAFQAFFLSGNNELLTTDGLVQTMGS